MVTSQFLWLVFDTRIIIVVLVGGRLGFFLIRHFKKKLRTSV